MEFEGPAIPVRGLEASVNYSFLAPKFTKWLDKKYRTYGVDFGPQVGYAFHIHGRLRTFGVQMTYNFSAS